MLSPPVCGDMRLEPPFSIRLSQYHGSGIQLLREPCGACACHHLWHVVGGHLPGPRIGAAHRGLGHEPGKRVAAGADAADCARLPQRRPGIVIDHRRTETAQRVDAEWLAVRPGTDGALALSMIHVLLEEGLHDGSSPNGGPRASRSSAHTSGVSPRKRRADHRDPRGSIRRAARAIAQPGGSALLSYTGLEYTTSGVQNIRAVMTLWALSGNLDVPAGT